MNHQLDNQLLLKFSRDTSKVFLSHNHMMSYMTKAFAREKRSAAEVNNPNFILKVNLTSEELLQNEIEEYLNQVDSTTTGSQPLVVEYKLAYQLLTQGKFDYIESMGEGCVKAFRVSLPSCLQLTLQQEKTLEARIGSVYGEIIVFYETIENAGNKTPYFNPKVVEIEEIYLTRLNYYDKCCIRIV